MMSSSVTPLVEEEGADVDGAKRVGGAAVSDRLDRNCASLRLMVAVSMAHMIEKWRKILVIAEGKMNLSWVVVFLNTSIKERIKC